MNIQELSDEDNSINEIKEITTFILLNLKRGICRYSND